MIDGFERDTGTLHSTTDTDSEGCGLTIVVMESGSLWPTWLNSPQGEHGSSTVQAQMHDESPVEFSTRVVGRVHEGQFSARISFAVLVWNDDMSGTALGSRFRIARAIVQAMRDVEGAEILVSAPSGADDSRQQELMALLAALCESLSDANVSLSVRFSTPAAKSSARLRIPDSEEDELEDAG